MSISPPPYDAVSRSKSAYLPVHQSVKIRNTYETLVEEIKVEHKEEWAQERAELQEQIETLRAQLPEEQMEKDEWREEHQNLMESLESVMYVARQSLES